MNTVHLPRVIERQLQVPASEARRLIDQGYVTLNGAVLSAGEHDATLGHHASILAVKRGEKVALAVV